MTNFFRRRTRHDSYTSATEPISEDEPHNFFACGTSCNPAEGCFSDPTEEYDIPIRSALRQPSQKWSGNPDNERDCNIKSSVSFDSVGIREFPLTIGHNPSALGPPVQLDYDNFSANKHLSLEQYEQGRQPRRSSRELRLSTRQRHVILREERNLPQQEINEAAMQAHEIRLQRSETNKSGWVDQQWEEFTESAFRKWSRCLSCTC